MLLKKIKYFIKENFLAKKINNYKNPICFIMLSATYGNMGDIAITCAQELFIKDILKEYKIIKIKNGDSPYYVKSILERNNKSDLITIVGGGNLGNLYKDFEFERRYIVKKFKKYKIISFPQTISFTNDWIGDIEKKRSVKFYSKYPNLYLFLREKTSYEYYKDKMKNVYLVPDVVFSLYDKTIFNVKKNKNDVVLCLRNDKEKRITFNNSVIESLNDNKIPFRMLDTHIGDDNLNVDSLMDELTNFILDFSNASLIVTDRLHGMIFSYITNTPCIVFDNINHKISSSYDTWLKNCESIKIINNYSNECLINNIKILMNSKTKNVSIIDKYDVLIKILKNR